jgi:hypothetical protein
MLLSRIVVCCMTLSHVEERARATRREVASLSRLKASKQRTPSTVRKIEFAASAIGKRYFNASWLLACEALEQ